MKRSKFSLVLGLALAVTAALTACGGGDGNDIATSLGLTKPVVRVIHAIPNGPNVDVKQNGTLTSLLNEPYKFVSKYFEVGDGSNLFQFNIAGTQTQIAQATVDSHDGHKYTVVAIPNTTGPDTVQIDDPFQKGILSNQARVRALNASANAADVDMYLTAPSVDINTVSPNFAGVAYRNAVPASGLDSVNLDGNTYRLRITEAGSKTVIFDSGSVELDNNADWLILTLPVDGIGQFARDNIKVLVAKSDDSAQTATELLNQPPSQ
jgi:hypothetical protein